jgi:hypothetical protein
MRVNPSKGESGAEKQFRHRIGMKMFSRAQIVSLSASCGMPRNETLGSPGTRDREICELSPKSLKSEISAVQPCHLDGAPSASMIWKPWMNLQQGASAQAEL